MDAPDFVSEEVTEFVDELGALRVIVNNSLCAVQQILSSLPRRLNVAGNLLQL